MNLYSVMFSIEYDTNIYGGKVHHTRCEGVERKLVGTSIQEALNMATQLIGSTFDYEFNVYTHAGETKPAKVVEITELRLDGKGL